MDDVAPIADAPARFPIPDGLRVRSAKLGRWMRIVGMIQSCAAGLGLLFGGLGALGAFAGGLLTLAALLTLLMLGMFGVLLRQGLMLMSAADHLTDLGDEPDQAHDHLELAFTRLRSVFVIDVVIGVLMLLRNAVPWIL